MDPYNLERFVIAQFPVYERVVQELLFGCKTSHWMWFVFPQIGGLGSSEQSRFFSINSIEEAKAYLQHDVLGPRLMDCTMLACRHTDKSAVDIFGEVDALKFRSCITLRSLTNREGNSARRWSCSSMGSGISRQYLLRLRTEIHNTIGSGVCGDCACDDCACGLIVESSVPCCPCLCRCLNRWLQSLADYRHRHCCACRNQAVGKLLESVESRVQGCGQACGANVTTCNVRPGKAWALPLYH